MKPTGALEAQIAMRDICRANAREAPGDERELWRSLAQTLDVADTYFWARPMCDLLEHAAQSLPPTWRFDWTKVPSRVGYVLFDRPIGWRGPDGEAAYVGALSWYGGTVATDQTKRCINFCVFNETASGIAPRLTGNFIDGETLLECVTKAPYEDDPDQLLMASLGATILATSLEIVHQKIVVGTQQRAERHARRRLERQGWVHEPAVRVIELRRTQSRSEPHGDVDPVEWSCQWIVSGFWRQQWYPSLNTHQPRWIMPYVKGDPTKPLKPPRAKIFAVIR